MPARGRGWRPGRRGTPARPSGTLSGDVRLKVADQEGAVRSDRGALGLDLVTRVGDRAGFLSAGGYHHHGLNTREGGGGSPPGTGGTAVCHPPAERAAPVEDGCAGPRSVGAAAGGVA